MKFTKQNNSNRKRFHKKMGRAEADIMTARMMLDDHIEAVRLAKKGIENKELPLSYYDAISDRLCGLPSRNIYS